MIACQDDAAQRVVTQIREHGVTSIVVGTSTPATAVITALGAIHFDETRSATVPLTMGKADPAVGLVSAPVQLVPYSPRAGRQHRPGGRRRPRGSARFIILVRQQVVATGINFNELALR